MPIEPHLRVYDQRSEFISEDGSSQVFAEGASDAATKARYVRITTALRNGFLRQQIERCRDHPETLEANQLTIAEQQLLERLVAAVTSEVGRALVGLTVLQLTVKSLEPEQSVRLHKGGLGGRDFSWRGGISMRSLDKSFITPVLRDYGLLKLNRDGFMMTRTLAENYPYSRFYKAQMRGAKLEWLAIVEALEAGQLAALPALHFLLCKLLNNAEAFKALATGVLAQVAKLTQQTLNRPRVTYLMQSHLNRADYAARIMEVQMHALMQACQELDLLGDARLVALSQMRSANKKHGNIGDIELMEDGQIVESWDAKFGKAYLRDELEELGDKLGDHPSVMVAGFVTSVAPERIAELSLRIAQLRDLYGVRIEIATFEAWVAARFDADHVVETQLAGAWLSAYAESLAQMRPALAPIDEPCGHWLETLQALLLSEVASQ